MDPEPEKEEKELIPLFFLNGKWVYVKNEKR